MIATVVAAMAAAAAFAGTLVWFVLQRRLRAMQARLQAAEAEARQQLAELAATTGGLAHEIRNPLSTLKLNLQLLAEDWRECDRPDADLLRRSLVRLETLRNEADRVHGILDDFLRYVGRHELSLRVHDINALMENLVDFFQPQAQANRIRMRYSPCPQPLPARLDADLFKQAILNLLINAQQAMQDGGELIIRTQRSDDRTARIDIADTGPGVPPEAIDKIFQAYYSTKKEGTGLGLPMTRRIIREHGGTITAQSEPGRGMSFTIRIPLVDSESQED